jgi:hypothetical protein
VKAALGVLLAVLLAPALTPSLAFGQGLGDVAARERARRSKEASAGKAPARALTNGDLEKGRPPSAKPAEGATAQTESTAEAAANEARPPVEEPGSAERPYRDAVMEAQNRVAEVERQINELSGQLNPQSTTFIYGPGGSNSANDELEVRSQLTAAEAELRQARAALDEANRALQAAGQRRRTDDR